ncbi:MAG: helix-hairpin-helix domain-containing protein, partial [Algoriella sp.]
MFEIFQNFSIQHDAYELTASDKVLLESYKIHSDSDNYTFNSSSKKFDKDSIKPFNPNNYSQEDWVKLGFSERQAEVIIKYKGIVGGEFTSKEQIKKCYVIDEEKYKELEPFLLLPEKSTSTFETKYPENKIAYTNFNPNDLPQQGWERIGFTPKQA